MTIIKATITGGRLELDVPAEWPDGTEVEIRPTWNGATDDDMPPEEIARVIAAMDQIEPLDLTDSEREAREAERKNRKDWEKAQFAKNAAKLREMWE